ncbi:MULTISPECIES: hypothetical protein [Enterobacteriaceae]|uniref:hypothetical protein n=1 Tax=Enterobacteriaceae TaxID=543 RepID=UPI0004950F69|nr:hypothetical protein [Franconibacter helveticus]EKW7979183.1 hypothetical protein [Enterobacter hormaechei]HBL5467953.1 hypothetical protein [Enterobacter hormaechei]HBL6068642.1 hypothetical protein [Enterobacter hormaechei]HBL6468532.1 hypothetical protein [Enterobacter hormaechei]HBL6490766.1 hypothetical protein [Enterobacter hormaechei]
MMMEIPGSVQDYYTESENEAGEKIYLANRQRLRALVSLINQKTQEVIASGGNPHTASLDLNDQFNDFISTAPVLAQVSILDVFAQEMNASAMEMNDEANRLNRQAAKHEAAGFAIGQWVGAGILLIFLLVLFGIIS